MIDSISRQLLRIINKQGRIEKIPVRLTAGFELTPTEGHTIQAIGDYGPLNVTDLGAHFGVTKSAASQIVGKLSKKGFIKKAFSEHNSKELRLQLTPTGKKAFEAIKKYRGQHFNDIIKRLGSFSLPQIATASVLLDVIEDVMNERLKQR
ncbi:MarR family transcriptional regulator [Desulfosarcina widdelii]|uniref:MarR family transcriptional regulator n=1 Tax=Desulfosarcina widdelii TaxID=947919 RepID=A0A5K7ZFR8_9BACT|nr:MarR family transcriptional regulator [Desulfosarcina widdelii]BBO78563.1 MarR family transcriptional regulator [Desulfosarcina widdelii]